MCGRSALIAVLLCLAIGAAVNVLVAWTAVCLPRPTLPSARPISIELQPWPTAVPADWPTRGRGHKTVYPGWESLVVVGEYADSAAPLPTMKLCVLSELRAGAPFRSMRTWGLGAKRGFRAGKDGWAWDVQLPWGTWVNLPLAPTWPGFALNTIVYAVVGFSVWRAVAWARRRGRSEQNECRHCGYSRDGLADGAACPECGNPK